MARRDLLDFFFPLFLCQMKYFVFTWIFFLFICITATDSHGVELKWKKEKVFAASEHLHVLTEDNLSGGPQCLETKKRHRLGPRSGWFFLFVFFFSPPFFPQWCWLVWICPMNTWPHPTPPHPIKLFLLLLIIANGVHQPERHQHKTRDLTWFFLLPVFFFFLFFSLVLLGHKTSQS